MMVLTPERLIQFPTLATKEPLEDIITAGGDDAV